MKQHVGFVYAAVLAAFGCGSGGGGDAVGVDPISHVEILPDPNTTVRQTIGRDGGVLRMTAPDGEVVVTVPPNAVIDPMTFAVTAASADVEGLAQLIVLEPDGATFLAPIEVRFVGKAGGWTMRTNGTGDDPHLVTPRTDVGDLVVDVFHFSTTGRGSGALPRFAPLSSEARARDALAREPQPIADERAAEIVTPWLSEVAFLVEEAVGNPSRFEESLVAFINLSSALQQLDLLPSPFGTRIAAIEVRLRRAFVLRFRDIDRAVIATDSLAPYGTLAPVFEAATLAGLTIEGSGATIRDLSAQASAKVVVENVKVTDEPETGVATLTASVGYRIAGGPVKHAPAVEVTLALNRAHFAGGTTQKKIAVAPDGRIEATLSPDALTYIVNIQAEIPDALVAPLDLSTVHTAQKQAGGPARMDLRVRDASTNDPFADTVTIAQENSAIVEARVSFGTVPMIGSTVTFELTGAGSLSTTTGTVDSDGRVISVYTPDPAAQDTTVHVRAIAVTPDGAVEDIVPIGIVVPVRATMSLLKHRPNYPSLIGAIDAGHFNCVANKPVTNAFVVSEDREFPTEMTILEVGAFLTHPADNRYEIALSVDLLETRTHECQDFSLHTVQAQATSAHTLLVTPITNGSVVIELGTHAAMETIVGVIRFDDIAELDAGTAPLTPVSVGTPIPMVAGKPFAIVVATRVNGREDPLIFTKQRSFGATFVP